MLIPLDTQILPLSLDYWQSYSCSVLGYIPYNLSSTLLHTKLNPARVWPISPGPQHASFATLLENPKSFIYDLF